MMMELQEQKVSIQKLQTIAESNSLDLAEAKTEINSLKTEIETLKKESNLFKDLFIRCKVITDCDSSDFSVEYIDVQENPIIENSLDNNSEDGEATQHQPNLDYEDMDFTETAL